MKIKTKNTKIGIASSVRLALHIDYILKTPNREVRLESWSKQSYTWRSIMKAVTFYV